MSLQVAQYVANLAEAAQRKEQERGIVPQPQAVSQKSQETKLNPVTAERAKRFDDTLKQALNYAFSTLRECNPAWRHAFKSKAEVVGYKTQLGLAMQSAGINSIELVEGGLDYARKQPGPFMPSTGDFVAWCKEAAEVKRAKRETVERSKRILDEKRQLAGETWEERQAAAKAGIAAIRKNLNGGAV
ncbi:MAG: hypothetical protein IE928_08685 [Gammaproteobacteria bacterium]|nr:hypothetical protein [Gammaproteobacteria bacterium]